MLDIYRWVWESPNEDKKELAVVILYKTPRCNQPTDVPGVKYVNDAVLCALRMLQIREALRTSTVAIAYAPRYVCFKELLKIPFLDRMAHVRLVNGGRFLQLILEWNRRKSGTPSVNITTPTIFGTQYYFTDCCRYVTACKNDAVSVSKLPYGYVYRLMWAMLVRGPEAAV